MQQSRVNSERRVKVDTHLHGNLIRQFESHTRHIFSEDIRVLFHLRYSLDAILLINAHSHVHREIQRLKINDEVPEFVLFLIGFNDLFQFLGSDSRHFQKPLWGFLYDIQRLGSKSVQHEFRSSRSNPRDDARRQVLEYIFPVRRFQVLRRQYIDLLPVEIMDLHLPDHPNMVPFAHKRKAPFDAHELQFRL